MEVDYFSTGAQDGATFARLILDAQEPELVELVHQLRQRRKLCAAVRALNAFAATPNDAFLGRRAMQRLGLECGG